MHDEISRMTTAHEESKIKYILVKELPEFKSFVFVPFKDLMFRAQKQDDGHMIITGILVGTSHGYHIIMNPWTNVEYAIADFQAKTPEELIVKLELNGFVYD